jgi:hypothetical protein
MARIAKNAQMIILKKEDPSIGDVLHEALEKRKLAEFKKKKRDASSDKLEDRKLIEEELKNLTEYFGALIEMDLE